MSEFSYTRPETLVEAVNVLGRAGSVPLGGGTDLLVTIDEGLVAPSLVVDVRDLPGARDVALGADGSLRIGSGVRIAELASNATIRAQFPSLANAAASVGTPALRNMGTLGGNLAQRVRCWYLRRGVKCFKAGGTACAAVEGEHQYHGIIAGGTCHAVHPSDPAVALLALDAQVEIARGSQAAVARRAGDTSNTLTRTISIDALFAGASSSPASETTLERGELITAVTIPAVSSGGVQHWEKLMQRGAWDFALVSCAAIRRADGTVRMALGGVGASPWRVPLSVEEDVASGGLDEESLEALAERAMYDAEPLPGTAYKVTLARTLLRRAMRALT